MSGLERLPAAFAVLGTAIALLVPGAARARADSGGARSEDTCRALATSEGRRLPDATITIADAVPAGSYRAPDGRTLPSVPAFCRVHGVASPVPTSHIGFEVWIPMRGWNGRALMFGNGGYSSAIDFPSMGAMLSSGYATVGTDTGHTGDDPDVFVQGAANPSIIVDWGHRAIHESIVNAKLVMAAFTGTPPRHSYFVGCSTGGHQALMEAQRYPGDFDGIVAGDPGNNRVALNAGFLWQYLRNHPRGDDARQIVPASKLPLLTNAAVRRCRGADGGLVTDDFLTDPRRCAFDPATLRCPGADSPSCLTDQQVAAVKEMYAGARDPRTGARVYPGWAVGSEAPVVDASGKVISGWNGYWGTTEPARANFWRYWVFGDPHWNWWTFDYHKDVRYAKTRLGRDIDATDPDLRPFRDRGGKLLMYEGWADPVVSPYDTIDYYRRVVLATSGRRSSSGTADAAALRRTQRFARLFMVPGMTHCGGGPGPNVFDRLTALVDWVEQGRAPRTITATKYVHDDPAQGVALTRELSPLSELGVPGGACG